MNLNNTTLILTGPYVPIGSESFRIVDNNLTDAVIGTFNGLPQGSIILNFLGSGLNVTISYTGGTSNDVVINVLPPGLLQHNIHTSL